ncbi:LysR family transcriptional regulator [Pelomonas sp. KK5]|uniref:LysR family transcriptional regulator n=1 Tax=Pelomonas sp. KK5 TaxID=1855730 RepID=UPI00097C2F78|nr:LysR family transcriptional regulator [Pelomonas sp. KK5]
MPIDLKLVEAFHLIVRSGSLTQAEAQSGQSKATLSRALVKLEQQLGAQLLSRTTRKLQLTEAGRAFHAHCETLLAEVSGRLEAAHTEVQQLHAGTAGTLRVLSDPQFSTTFVCHVTRLFLEQHPKLHCQLDVAGQQHAPDAAQVDCYVCEQPPDLPNLIAKPLGRLDYGLYASPVYLDRHGLPDSPAGLARHQMIISRDAPAGLAATPAILSNDYWTLKTFCIDGFGIALLPDFFARPEVKRRILQPVLPDWKPEQRRIYCAYQRQRYMGRKLRAFVDLMAECLADIESFNMYVGSR